MAQPVRIIGKSDGRDKSEGIQAQVDSLGNLHVREGTYPGLMKTYEDSSFVTGDSPAVHDFYTDKSAYAIDGYLVCDGDGDIQVDYTRDGIVYSDKATMKKGEQMDLLRLDIRKIRITWVADSAYRIVLI